MFNNKLYFAILTLLVFASCVAKKIPTVSNDNFEQLQKMMKGSFDSSEQASIDTSYYDISLHMYPIWTSREGHFLYVEQAVTKNQSKPYRQRIYKLIPQGNGIYASEVYTLKDPDRFIGKWREPAYFDSFNEKLLEIREGCTVYLESKSDGSFSGATKEKACTSSLRGASYANSIVQVYSDKIISWDQGFDAEDNQVWGATAGGYIFKRKALTTAPMKQSKF